METLYLYLLISLLRCPCSDWHVTATYKLSYYYYFINIIQQWLNHEKKYNTHLTSGVDTYQSTCTSVDGRGEDDMWRQHDGTETRRSLRITQVQVSILRDNVQQTVSHRHLLHTQWPRWDMCRRRRLLLVYTLLLSPVLTAWVNGPSWRVTGFHYPSTRAVLTGVCFH